MDDQRLGAAVRAVRIRRRLRQTDVALAAGVSRTSVSRIERGHVGTLAVDTLRRVAGVLDVRIDLIARWRAGELDRLLNARHSRLHELVAGRFRELPGWVIEPEVSFAFGWERGIVDILAFHGATGTILVIELKTDIADVNELAGTLDRKRRLGPRIAAGHGWLVRPGTQASAWLIVAESTVNRRRVAAHRSMLRAALPSDGRTITGWLMAPAGTVRALSFWSDAHPGNVGSGLRPIRRVSGPRAAMVHAQDGPARPSRRARTRSNVPPVGI